MVTFIKSRASLKWVMLAQVSDHDVLFQEKSSEAQWSVTIAQHLLLKLSVTSTYTVTSSPGFTLQEKPLCPCKEKDQLIGKIGDTSFGCEDGWHGSSDIIMDDFLQVSVIKDGDGKGDGDSDDDTSDSSIEIKMDEGFMQKDIHQIIAQTIVFSFLQQKENKEKYSMSLVPGIGISGNKILFYYYDSKNDVLLASKPMEFFRANKLLPCPIVVLWLTVNYQLFCTGITDEMKAYKADFFKRVDDQLEMYVENVARPMHIPHTTPGDLFPWEAFPKKEKETLPTGLADIVP